MIIDIEDRIDDVAEQLMSTVPKHTPATQQRKVAATGSMIGKQRVVEGEIILNYKPDQYGHYFQDRKGKIYDTGDFHFHESPALSNFLSAGN